MLGTSFGTHMIEDVFASTGFILFFENIPQSLYGELVVEASHAGESEIATCVVLLKLTVPPFFLKYIEVQNEKWPSRLCSFMKYFVRFILLLF